MRYPNLFNVTLGVLLSWVLLLAHTPAALARNTHTLPLFMSASDMTRQGFVRIINRSDRAGTVTIRAIDDAGDEADPVTLGLAASQTVHFNSGELEDGGDSADRKGLSGTTGSGEGNWWLKLETDLDIEPLAYIWTPADGFLTSIHDVAQGESMRWNVVIFNPGSNTSQKSLLRLINTSGIDTEVVVSGLDDQGNEASGEVEISLPANEARLYSALDLEDGHSDFEGSLGTGSGKWQLFVSADHPIQVMSLMSTPTGHMTNLSTGGPRRADDLLEADPSIAQYLTGPVEQGKSPGLLAAIIAENGVRAVAVAGVRKQGSTQVLTVNDMLKIHSNTKAMTSTMLATMVADGTFSRGWQTTIADVFPELLGEVHRAYRSVNLRQLVTMTGGIARNAANGYWDHQQRHVGENRYRILRDQLKYPPVGPVGQFSYSNLGYMIAGAMAERVAGKSWETLMEERLFTPLGMTTAGFRFQEGPDYGEEQPSGHVLDEGGSWEPWWLWRPPAWGPAATVYVSVADWAKFIGLWFLEGDPAILDRSTLDGLVTPDSDSYAAGWVVVSRDWAGGVALFHNGSSCCWYTTLWVAPNRGVAYVAAANSYDPESTGQLLDSIIMNLINHDSSRSAGVDLVTRDDVIAPHWDNVTRHDPVVPGVRLRAEP